jgi:hypothetical protein
MGMIACVGIVFCASLSEEMVLTEISGEGIRHAPLNEVRMQRLQPANPFSSVRVGLMAMIAA